MLEPADRPLGLGGSEGRCWMVQQLPGAQAVLPGRLTSGETPRHRLSSELALTTTEIFSGSRFGASCPSSGIQTGKTREGKGSRPQEVEQVGPVSDGCHLAVTRFQMYGLLRLTRSW